jgi:hypothetical protein
MDVEAVRRLARDLTAQARRLDAVQTQVGRLVQQGGELWKGTDASGFASSWNLNHLPRIRDLVKNLDELAERARTNADEQDVASGGSGHGGVAGGGGGGGGGGSWGDESDGKPWNPFKGEPVDPFKDAREAADKQDRRYIGAEYYNGSSDLAEKGLASDGDISLSKIRELAEKGDLDLVKGKAEWSGSVASVESKGSADLGGGVTGEYQASAAFLAASAAASGTIGLKDGIPTASGKASAEADLLKAEASGKIGTDAASLTGVASAVVGAKAAASGSISAQGIEGKAGVNAFAGVQASATAQVDVGGVKPSVTGQVYAGIGAHANAEVSVTADHVKASVDIGAALGVGAGVSFDVDINVSEVANTLSHLFHW